MGWLRDTLGRWSGGDGAGGGAAAVHRPLAPDWLAAGNAALGAEDLAEAARCYEQGALASPGDGTFRLNLGFALLEQGQPVAAIERLQQAIALGKPGDTFVSDAHFLLGRAQVGIDQLEAAFHSFEEAVRLRPDFVEAVEEAARVLHRLERHAQAVDWAQRLCELRPEPFTRMLLGNELMLSGRHADAADVLAAVCAQEPTNLDASVLLYGSLLKLQRNEEALAEADRALALTGADAGLYVNRSVPLERLGRLDEAMACLEQALAHEPGRRDAMLNRVSILLQQVRVREAVAAAEQALQLYPEDADLHWSLCLGLLLLGDYQRGWAESEWRMRSVAFRSKVLQLEQPMWRGESLAGRTIFLHAEQGFGDNIQFVRFVPEVARLAQTVLLLVSGPLEPLIEGALPPNCRLLPQHSVLPPIDFHCPLMSLPAVLGTTLETLPAQVPYLHPTPALVGKWRQRLDASVLNVGVAWSGNPRHVNDRNRSMSLALFRAAQTPGCRFVTVQPELRDGEREAFLTLPRALDLGREVRDFADSAALVEALDLVITVDTSVAHLAGAVNRPVWILLPHSPDWRWLLDRSDSPWYPSARIYRQPVAGDWASVMAAVRSGLQTMIAER